MTVRMSMRTNVDRAVKDFRGLREDVQKKATYRALNRALDASATASGREIRKVYNVKQRAVRNALAKRRANAQNLLARLTVDGIALGLIEFSARWSPRQAGASVQVKVANGRKVIQHSFIAESRGGRQVFVRVGKKRLPIRALKSISVPQAFTNKAVLDAMDRVAVEAFSKNYMQQIRFLNGWR